MKNGVASCNDNKPEGSDHGEVNSEPVSWMNKIRARIAFVTIEPFLICYFLSFGISAGSVHNLNFEKACDADLKYTEEKCSEDKVMTEIQSMVYEMTIWKEYLNTVISSIIILFVAAWSDHSGNRKTLMLVSMLGYLVYHFGLCLTTYFFDEWSLFVTGLIEVLPITLSGGFQVAIMSSYCHLAEVTSLETRTFRIGITGVVISLCPPTARLISQKFKNIASYYGIFGISCALNVLGLLYTYFRINDVKTKNIEAPWQRKFMNFINPSNAWKSLGIAFNPGPDRLKILLVIAAHAVIKGPLFGVNKISYSYLTHKYGMDVSEITKFDTYVFLIGASGIFVIALVISKYLKVHDVILGVLATVSMMISSCMYGLAPSKFWIYSVPIFNLFGQSYGMVNQSLRYKIVPPEQFAKLYSLNAIVESITELIYVPMYVKIYNYTVNTIPGAVFLVETAMTAPAILIFIVLYKKMKKEERDRVTDPQSKELYANENYVTSL